ISDATRSVLPAGLQRKVDRDPGVAQSAGIFLLVTTVQGKESSLVFGLDPNEFPARRLTLVRGFRGGALVGDRFGAVGDVLRIRSGTFRVTGIFHSGNRFEDQAVVLPLPTVQALAQRPGEVTTIAVTVKLGERPQ